MASILTATAARPVDGTRAAVARYLLQHGRVTATDVAAALDITPAGVRRHLDALLDDGLVEAREAPAKGRGRPPRLFGLTDKGREQFEQSYDDLARSALRFLAEVGGPAAVEAFAKQRVAELEERYRPAVDAAAPDRRPAVLADALSADGYAASTQLLATADGDQLCQRHCPVAHVAGEFPQLCAAETEVFARLLGSHVQRLATIAHGADVCTTFVPHRRPPAVPPSAPHESTTSPARRETA